MEAGARGDVRFYHHRLDLDPPNSLCNHFASPATLEAGTLYLTPYAYKTPHTHFQGGSNLTADDVMAGLEQFQKKQGGRRGGVGTAATESLVSPDVRAEIRTIAAKITPQWKNTSYNSVLNNFIVRRYQHNASLLSFICEFQKKPYC